MRTVTSKENKKFVIAIVDNIKSFKEINIFTVYIWRKALSGRILIDCKIIEVCGIPMNDLVRIYLALPDEELEELMTGLSTVCLDCWPFMCRLKKYDVKKFPTDEYFRSDYFLQSSKETI